MFHLLNLWNEEWTTGDKVSFDGNTRQIHIHAEVNELDVKADIYSAWKRWLQRHNNAAFLPAIRVVGGDLIGNGSQQTGDLYFLQNGWRIYIDHFVRINGIIYHDDNIEPFIIAPSGGVIATVSAIAQTVSTAVPVVTGDLSAVQSQLSTIQSSITDDQTSKLTAAQETMLMEIYSLMGLDPTKPLHVTGNARTAGEDISQVIDVDGEGNTTVTRT